jgi:hypothetical protein
MPLEILNGAFVFLGGNLCLKRAEISPFSRLRIFLPRIQPILSGFEFPDHEVVIVSGLSFCLQGNRQANVAKLRYS